MSNPSQAAQVIVSIIPIVGIVTGGIVAFFYLLWSYRAKRLLIEKGLYEAKGLDVDTFSLLAGLVLGMVGVVLLAVFMALGGASSYSILGGAIPLAVGAALLAFYMLRKKSGA